MQRIVNQPIRHGPEPIISGVDQPDSFMNFNYTASVIRDAESGLFRLWYTAYDPVQNGRVTAYVESADGLDWELPFSIVPGTLLRPIDHVLDEGEQAADPSQRFKAIVASDEEPIWQGEVLVSPDGQNWQKPEQSGLIPGRFGEIWRPFVDVVNGGFGMLFRWNRPYTWKDAEGVEHNNTLHDKGFVRLFATTTSHKFGEVLDPSLVFAPDEFDSGETQFYSISNVIRRGDYYVTALSILRDDLKASETPEEVYSPLLDSTRQAYGMGYTVLAWSRDGQHWLRDRHQNPYFEPDGSPAAWDHAHAWISSMVEVDNKVYLYYGGYKYGHKVFFDRQIGLAMAIQDRYVARVSGDTPGILRTPLLTFNADRLSLNVDAAGGEVRLQIQDESGQPFPGFAYADCQPTYVDALEECTLINARLFAFNLEQTATEAAAP
jgi:hypothetical protein